LRGDFIEDLRFSFADSWQTDWGFDERNLSRVELVGTQLRQAAALVGHTLHLPRDEGAIQGV
jgi:hypothetical protein